MAMRLIFSMSLLLTTLFFTYSSATAQNDNVNTESIIIEVEGDPYEHKQYMRDYYPFIEVITVFDTLFKGLALKAEPRHLEKVGSLAFIKQVHQVHTYQTMENPLLSKKTANRSLPYEINQTSFTGKGVKVGVIDTGIDYNHPDLSVNYKGGYDLVDLDDDPMETTKEQGMPTLHGTHVAGIIAANGELTGVAPQADLYAYRALGPGGMGTSVQVIAAIEQAVKDRMDIINLSLGNTVNGPDYPTSLAVNRAVELGTMVVIANGNAGPDQWTVGSPATAPKALAVGAATPREMYVPILYEPKGNKFIQINPLGESPEWDLKKDYEIVTENDASIRGKIVLADRSDRSFYEIVKLAEIKGAAAVLIANNEKGSFLGALEPEGEPVIIPAASLSKEEGAWLKSKLKQENNLYIETKYKSIKQTIANFSSRGPVTKNWEIKPDVIAPGTNVVSTIPEGYVELNGTSMAAPHVAGALTVLKEAKSSWSNEQFMAALTTTAQRMEDHKGQPIDPTSQGMGMIDLEKAIETDILIYDSLLTFGKINGQKKTEKETVTIENLSHERKTFSFKVPKKQKGWQWTIPQMITIEGKSKKKIPISLKIDPDKISENIHQGYVTLHELDKDQRYHLPYVFINQAADYDKAMGFEFSLQLFSKDAYRYSYYLPDPAKKMEVHLYDPDTYVYQHLLLEENDLESGFHEGQTDKSNLKHIKPGNYIAIVTITTQNNTHETYIVPGTQTIHNH